jgi:ribosomal protein S27AE
MNEVARAGAAVLAAIKSGRLRRPLFCGSCGLTRRQSERQAGRKLLAWYPFLHAHHDDYSELLVVRWLCNRCHGAHHRALKARLSDFDQWDWMRWAHWKPLAKDAGGIPRAQERNSRRLRGNSERLKMPRASTSAKRVSKRAAVETAP